MTIVFTCLVIALGVIHLIVMALEMFADADIQSLAFEMDKSFVKQSGAQVSLKNLGIYNGMLGVSLLATFGVPDIAVMRLVQLGLAEFVLIVGIFGGLTVTKKIFLIQVLPAVVAPLCGGVVLRG